MQHILPRLALLAWIAIQLPLYVCSTPCGVGVGVLPAMGEHACHASHLVVNHEHAHHCRHGHDHGSEKREQLPEDHGHHTLVQIQATVPANVAVFVKVADAGQAMPLILAACVGTTEPADIRKIEGDPAPPADADPVSLSVRLLV